MLVTPEVTKGTKHPKRSRHCARRQPQTIQSSPHYPTRNKKLNYYIQYYFLLYTVDAPHIFTSTANPVKRAFQKKLAQATDCTGKIVDREVMVCIESEPDVLYTI
jgi:hypothetical protein